jgi:hypothetical protein
MRHAGRCIALAVEKVPRTAVPDMPDPIMAIRGRYPGLDSGHLLLASARNACNPSRSIICWKAWRSWPAQTGWPPVTM